MRLIDADALIENLKNANIPYNADINYFIAYAPTIDAVQREQYESMEETCYKLQQALSKSWIPCSERLPKEDEEVLVYLYGDVPYLAYIDSKGQWNTEYFTIGEYHSPLAWMPLPEPYKAD